MYNNLSQLETNIVALTEAENLKPSALFTEPTICRLANSC